MSALPPVAFTCEHCGAKVRERNGGTLNACPECQWSKHVQFGTTAAPPCGAMMRPALVGGNDVVHYCTGCGFTMRGPTEAAQAAQVAFPAALGEPPALRFEYGDTTPAFQLEDHLDVPAVARGARP